MPAPQYLPANPLDQFVADSMSPRYVDVTLTLDTNIYASGDVIADTQVITAACPASDAPCVLNSISLIDEDDQKVALYFLFFDSNVSLGTENSAPSISDANARSSLGAPIAIAAADYYDLGGVAIVGKDLIGKVVKPATGTSNIYFAVLNATGTPTYTASGLKVRFGFI